MEKVTVDDVEPSQSAGEAVRRALAEPLDTTDLAINHYRLDPDERISGLHGHGDQEEVFVVVDGSATFETLDIEDSAGDDDVGYDAGEVTVDAGETIRFAPGEYQSGKNVSGETAVVYGLGAPRDSEDVRIPLTCPECDLGYRRPAMADDGETVVLACPGCGAESRVECPECGGNDLTATLDEVGKAPVSRCLDCGATLRDR